jgi:hypothetical protein
VSPLKGKTWCLPLDCSDIEWTEPVAVATPKPKRSFSEFETSVAAVALPEPVQFKSLAETLGGLVAAVRSFKRRPVHPLASAFLFGPNEK